MKCECYPITTMSASPRRRCSHNEECQVANSLGWLDG